MSTILPPFIAIKSTLFDTYLSYSNDSDSQNFGFLKFNGGNVFSSLAKFEVVKANTGVGLVHLRCSHNKKFLQQRTFNGLQYLTPEADEPVEDRLSATCTLFEPQLVEVDGDTNKVRLLLHRSNQAVYTIAVQQSNQTYFRTEITVSSTDTRGMFEVTDLESLIILPKHVAFKNDNGDYLTIFSGVPPLVLMQLKSTDKGDPSSWFVVSTDGHGRAQIMSYLNKQFWRYNSGDGSILVDTPNPTATATTSQLTSFLPIKVDRNVTALRSFANDNFCGPSEFRTGIFISAKHPTVVTPSRLVMEELVLSRSIYNADFDLANAVIYGETPVNMATANISNNSSTENTAEFKFAYTKSRSTTWTANYSWTVGVSVSASFKIPFIGSAGIDISTEYSGSYEWGETLTSENTLETTYSVVVPPHTSVTVSLMATKGFCDVPFSYYQRDVLYDGRTEIYRKDDGLYTGINSYNFRYEVAETSTDSSRADQPTIYREQKIPMPSDAAVTQPLPSSENKATQEQNLEGVPLPLEETSQEQKVQLPLEETVDEVQKLSLSSGGPSK